MCYEYLRACVHTIFICTYMWIYTYIYIYIYIRALSQGSSFLHAIQFVLKFHDSCVSHQCIGDNLFFVHSLFAIVVSLYCLLVCFINGVCYLSITKSRVALQRLA